jgi:dipeptidyl-peptidase 4
MKRILFICFLISFSFFQTTVQAQKEITLEDVWLSPKFYPNFIDEIRSMNDGEHYCTLESNKIVKYKYKNANEVGVIYDAKENDIKISDYQFSADETKILLATNMESIYRHSTIAEFYIWDINTKELTALSKNGEQRLAEFSPNGEKVAFVRDNNIFIVDLNTMEEKQITTDGKDDHIIYGTMDWVYEEEFGFTKGFYWSPEGDKIAYYKLDESNVKEFTMIFYGDLYPEKYDYKYPKAGEDNSIVNVFIYNLDADKHLKVDIGEETDIYIPRIKWTNSNEILAVQRMNRLQNKLEILLADATNGSTEVIYNETNKYYIDITDNWHFLNNGKEFVITSEQDGYNHIYTYNMKGEMVKQLTKGGWDVMEILGIDEDNNNIYYISAESSPINRDVSSVCLSGDKKKTLSTKEGHNSAEFSANYQYYINTFSDANTPMVFTINNNQGKELHTIEDNATVKENLEKHGFTPMEFFTFNTSEDIELNGWMIKPADFDKDKEYPVFMYVYGGPGAQTVENSWGWFNYSWHQMLAQNGYIVVSVDGRGTGARGEEFKKCTYQELGNLETIDMIETAKYLGGLEYVDKERIGIWGWSYGGYMTTLCMTKGADYFSTGIAVAPVTNWRYYDNIYTERFMRTPQENANGYDDNSPINHVKKLKGNYLLVHGTGDDNVHVQNSYDLVSALVNANKQFEMQFYPNKNHSIYGGYTRYHLYKRMTEFIYENL